MLHKPLDNWLKNPGTGLQNEEEKNLLPAQVGGQGCGQQVRGQVISISGNPRKAAPLQRWQGLKATT